MFMLLILVSITFCVGALMPSFRMRSLGIIGRILDLGNSADLAGAEDRPFSIFVLVGFISAQADDYAASQIGINGICLLFLFCSFIVPVLQTLTLAALWWMKLTIRGQKKLLMANEVQPTMPFHHTLPPHYPTTHPIVLTHPVVPRRCFLRGSTSKCTSLPLSSPSCSSATSAE
jgi:hypothetical protein